MEEGKNFSSNKSSAEKKRNLSYTHYSSFSRDGLFIVESAFSSPVRGTALK